MFGQRRLNVFLTILLFVTAVVIVTGAVITAANYLQTRQATSRVASADLDRVVDRINSQISDFFGDADLLVDIYANTPRVTGGVGDITPLLQSLFAALNRAPQVAGVYAGYENGDFWEAFSFSASDGEVLVSIGAPPATHYALEIISHAGDARSETWTFFDSSGQAIGTRRNDAVSYDPRSRDWYKQARAQPETFIRTAPYSFRTGARAGVTVAKTFASGAMPGVMGTDVTLDRLSTFLEQIRPNPAYRVLIFDSHTALLASSSDRSAASRGAKLAEITDPPIKAAVQDFLRDGPFSVRRLKIDGEIYLASIAALDEPDLPKGSDFILNVAPLSLFEGSLAGAATRTLLLGLLVILAASPLLAYAARLVSGPLTQLANNANLIEAILDTAPNPIFYKDADARYVACNRALEAYFNRKRADVVGRRLREIGHLSDQDAEEHERENARIISSGGSIRREISLTIDDGEPRKTLYLARGFRNADGSPGGLVGALVDITELKATQEALAHARDLAEAATRAKAEFLASMSHEIRTPLNGINGMAELLAQSLLDEDQKHMLRSIRDSGNALMTVINDILDFSKIEAGKLAVEQVPMSVDDALEGAAVTLTPAATGKGIRIHTFVDPEIPHTLAGDPVRVRQILFNLIGNAVKFSNGRDVTARATHVAGDGPPRVLFEVIDRGIGISEENQTKLFAAFSQAEASTTRRYGGTGLGLAICRRLADLMGGTIGLTSRLGEGSTFFVELPFGAVDSPGSKPKRDLTGLDVLLIDLAPERRHSIELYLGHWGAREVTAEGLEGALAACAAQRRRGKPFDCAIVDGGLDQDWQRGFMEEFQAEPDGMALTLILLRDFQNRGARIKGPQLVTVDANPLIRHRIVTAVAVAAGRASPEAKVEDDDAAPAAARAPTVDEALSQGRLILLVEDNPTNQDVIRRQLERIGYACEIAANGRRALEAWERKRYRLILTDCHMPEMDGYELTGTIREAEQTTSGRIPIIAITANALQGEAERCLAAGMDDYLTKPVTLGALKAALQKWMPSAAGDIIVSASLARAAPVAATAGGAVDDRVIKDMFGDDPAQFKEILSSFVEPSQAIIIAVGKASLAQDGEGVRQGAHQLKSSARTIGANALADTCAALEAAGRKGDWTTIERLMPQAEKEMTEVVSYIGGL